MIDYTNTATRTEFIAHCFSAIRTVQPTDAVAIESWVMTDREFRQKIADMLARQRKEAEEQAKKPPAQETSAKPKTKRRKAS